MGCLNVREEKVRRRKLKFINFFGQEVHLSSLNIKFSISQPLVKLLAS